VPGVRDLLSEASQFGRVQRQTTHARAGY
jgi:hypothetical protein